MSKLLSKLLFLSEQDVDWTKFSTSTSDDNDAWNDPVTQALLAMGNDPEGRKVLDAHNQQKTQNYHDALKNNAQLLATTKNIHVNQLKELGKGEGGIAFSLDDKRVFKITTDVKEARVANGLHGKALKGIANIYDVWKFPNSNFYGLIIEKIIPFKSWPEDNLKDGILELTDVHNIKDIVDANGNNWKAAWQNITTSLAYALADQKQGIEQAFMILARIAKELMDNGIQGFSDIHTGNIGKRASTGEVVIFDIGFAQGGSEPPVLGAQ